MSVQYPRRQSLNRELILSTGRVIEKIKKENKNKMVNYNCEYDKSTARDYRIQIFFVFISIFISLLQVAIKKQMTEIIFSPVRQMVSLINS